MHRSVLVGLVVLVLVATGIGAAVAFVTDESVPTESVQGERVDGEDSAHPATAGASVVDTDQEFDRTTFRIHVRPDGSAVWTFEYERSLASDEEVEDFRTFAEQFESEETDLYVRFTEQAAALVASGEEHTEREMTVDDFERSTHVDDGRVNRMGVVRMSFTWHNFAPVDDEGRVVVSDVFEGGFYLMSDQKLTVEVGDGLAFEDVRPEPAYAARNIERADAVTWLGEKEFADSHPYLLLVPEDEVGVEEGDGGGAGGWFGATTIVSVALLLAVLGLVAFARHRFDEWPLGDRSGGDATVAPDPAATVGEESPDESIGDEELLSDEDRVVALIRQNGGRMKQVNIVEETGWSKSKVSMLLSDMEEAGTISKLRVGRENIISLEGFEPEATKSPFDE